MYANLHTHLELTFLQGRLPTGSFARWLRGILLSQPREASPSRLAAAVGEGVERLIASGTRVVADISATGASVEPLLERDDLVGVVYYEVLGLDPARAEEILDRALLQIDRWRRRARRGVQVGISLHAPYSCSARLLELGAWRARAEELPLCLHVAESPEEVQLLTEGQGPLADLFRELGIEFTPPGLRPVPYLEETGVLEAGPLLVHCVQVSREEVERLARYGVRVVHCPRSNAALGCGRMPLEQFLEAGIPVALGTDSLASSPSLDVREEAEFAVELHKGHVDPERIWEMVRAEAWEEVEAWAWGG